MDGSLIGIHGSTFGKRGGSRQPGRVPGPLPLAFAFLSGAVCGALLMFVVDPEMARTRRALARDRAVAARRHVEAVAQATPGRVVGLPSRGRHVVEELAG